MVAIAEAVDCPAAIRHSHVAFAASPPEQGRAVVNSSLLILTTLAEARLPADRLVLEVTESALVDELDVGVKALVELRQQRGGRNEVPPTPVTLDP